MIGSCLPALLLTHSDAITSGAESATARAAILERYREKKRRRGDGSTVRYHMRQVGVSLPLGLWHAQMKRMIPLPYPHHLHIISS